MSAGIYEAKRTKSETCYTGSKNCFAKEFASIKIYKETATIVRIYGIFNNQKVYDFTGKVLEKELERFKKKIKNLSKE